MIATSHRTGRFLAELRRRHVFRVALGYGAMAWVVVEVAATVLPILGAPGTAVRVVTVLAVLSFPPVLALSWVFDLTSEGIRRTPARAAGPAAVSDRVEPDRVGAAADLRRVVALPFVDTSPKNDHRLLAHGFTEELIHGLARVRGLCVVAQTTAAALARSGDDVREIGARVGAGAVVEGSVRVAGDRMRLNVRLVSSADGVARWAEVFERRIDDWFAVQDEVAATIVATIGRRLVGSRDRSPPAVRKGPIVPAPTSDLRAYTLYLNGRARWKERSPEALHAAEESFEEAIRLDPGFARAHAGLADVHSLRVDYGLVPPGEGLPDARRAADEALRLGAGLAEAHTSAALVRQLEGAWREARDGFERALELNPGYEVARHRYALLLAWLGHTDEARRQIEVARKLDPLSPVVTATVGWIEYYAGDFAAAEAAAREALAADPGLVTGRVVLALSLVAAGLPEAAADELRDALARGEGGGVRALLVHALGRAGRDARAAVELDRLRDGNGGYVSPYWLAVALLGTGDRGGALAALDRAVATGTPQVVYLREDPLFDVLRSDRRFRALLVRADLVHPLRSGEDARRSGAATVREEA